MITCDFCDDDPDLSCACGLWMCAKHSHVEVGDFGEVIRCPRCCDGRCGAKTCERYIPED